MFPCSAPNNGPRDEGKNSTDAQDKGNSLPMTSFMLLLIELLLEFNTALFFAVIEPTRPHRRYAKRKDGQGQDDVLFHIALSLMQKSQPFHGIDWLHCRVYALLLSR
jgi:hypothetical protein